MCCGGGAGAGVAVAAKRVGMQLERGGWDAARRGGGRAVEVVMALAFKGNGCCCIVPKVQRRVSGDAARGQLVGTKGVRHSRTMLDTAAGCDTVFDNMSTIGLWPFIALPYIAMEPCLTCTEPACLECEPPMVASRALRTGFNQALPANID